MTFVLDASTLINLANGEVLAAVLATTNTRFLISSAVRRESKSIAHAVDAAVASGQLGLVDDNLIPVSLFQRMQTALKLGEGETECLIAAASLNCGLACDDGAAREAAAKDLGPDRVIGSLRLLQMACRAGTLSASQAENGYRLMIARGGFLPPLPKGYFQ